MSYQYSQALRNLEWKITLFMSTGGNLIATHPNFLVHMPIIPQSGIKIVTTTVTKN